MNLEQAPNIELHAEEYRKAKTRLLEIFQNKNRDEIKEMYSEIRRFATIINWDPEEAVRKIEESYNQENPDVFVNTSFEAVKDLIDHRIEHPEAFERVRREGVLQHQGNVKLSELMYYNMDMENNTAFIHIAPKGDMKLGEIIRSFREGMKELARQVKEDERIKEIQATSWIVASNPGLLKKAGFIVEGAIDEKTKIEHFDNETRMVSWAHISREDLLKKYLDEDHVVISDGVRYNVDKLIEISKAVEPKDIPITEFDKTMDTECWDDSNGKMIKPKDVLEAIKSGANVPEMEEHMERVKKSDPNHPILAVNIEGEPIVIDGVHRLAKSFLENRISIPVVRFDSIPKEAEIS